VAFLTASFLLYGAEDPRGRPADGYRDTVRALTLNDVRASLPRLINPGSARFVFVGDFEPAALRAELDRRFGGWSAPAAAAATVPDPPSTLPPRGSSSSTARRRRRP